MTAASGLARTAALRVSGAAGCSAMLGSQVHERSQSRIRELCRLEPTMLLVNQHRCNLRSDVVADDTSQANSVKRLG